MGRGAPVWLMLMAGPVLFVLAIIAVSVWVGAQGIPPEQIGAVVPLYAPHILLGVLAALAVLVLWRLPMRQLWAWPEGSRPAGDAALGALVGVALAVAYLSVLAPAMTILQRDIGDYVPPGSVLAAVSGNLWLFLVANVLLAPWVEETIYRGHAMTRVSARAVVLSCLAFGALHWTGGLWYMVLTALVAGGAFAALRVARGGLMAPFAAHLTLNLIEFGWAAS